MKNVSWYLGFCFFVLHGGSFQPRKIKWTVSQRLLKFCCSNLWGGNTIEAGASDPEDPADLAWCSRRLGKGLAKDCCSSSYIKLSQWLGFYYSACFTRVSQLSILGVTIKGLGGCQWDRGLRSFRPGRNGLGFPSSPRYGTIFYEVALSFAAMTFERGWLLILSHCYRLVVHAGKKSVKGSDLPVFRWDLNAICTEPLKF